MSLDKDKLAKALAAYEDYDGGVYGGIEAAIESYLKEMFKPNQLVKSEPIQPTRDYRKELWIGIRLQDADIDEANAALADFDKTFSKERPRG